MKPDHDKEFSVAKHGGLDAYRAKRERPWLVRIIPPMTTRTVADLAAPPDRRRWYVIAYRWIDRTWFPSFEVSAPTLAEAIPAFRDQLRGATAISGPAPRTPRPRGSRWL